MDFSTLSPARRTIRRFEQRIVPDEMLKHLIDMARFASCASNKQRLRYVIIRENELVRKVFETTAWAGMVAPKRTPKWGIDAPLDFIAVTASLRSESDCASPLGVSPSDSIHPVWSYENTR